MSYIPIGKMTLLERIRKFINKRGTELTQFDSMPVAVVNDDFTEQVNINNAERTTTGTTALLTTLSGKNETWITHLTLTGSTVYVPGG